MIDEKVTPSFWLSEFLLSDTAVRKGLDNMPHAIQLANLKNILMPNMQAVRDSLGCPVFVTSGYRSPEVNRAVGGAPTSDHVQGLAADFKAPEFGPPIKVAHYILEHMDLKFKQLIAEGQWVHISFPAMGEMAKREVLTAHFGDGPVSYTQGLA